MQVRARIGSGGRLAIPVEFREALGLEVGSEMMPWLKDDEVRISTSRQAIRRAQALVRQYVPEGRSLVEELIAQRRAEAERA